MLILTLILILLIIILILILILIETSGDSGVGESRFETSRGKQVAMMHTPNLPTNIVPTNIA